MRKAAGSRPQSNYGQAARNNNQKVAEGNNERNNYNRVVAKARPVGSALGQKKATPSVAEGNNNFNDKAKDAISKIFDKPAAEKKVSPTP